LIRHIENILTIFSQQEVYILHVKLHELNHYIELWLWNDYKFKWKPYSKYYTGSRKGGEAAYRDDEETLNTNYSETRYDLDGFMRKNRDLKDCLTI